MNQPSDFPEPVQQPMGMPPPQSGGNMGRLMQIVLTVVISAVVTFVMTNMLFPTVTKSDFESNLKNITSDISNLKGSVTTISELQQKVSTIAGMQTTINKLQTDYQALQNTLNNPNSQYAKQGDLTNLQNTVNGINSSINNSVANSQSVKDLQAQNKILNDAKDAQAKTLEAQSKTIAEHTKAIDELKNKTSTTTTTGTGTTGTTATTNAGSSTYGSVTASLISYSSSFGNGNTSAPQVLSFTPTFTPLGTSLPTAIQSGQTLVSMNGNYYLMSKTISQQFQLQIANNTGKSISEIQLGLVFAFIKGDGSQFAFPSGTTFTVSSLGTPQWQNTGSDQTYTGWYTGNSGGILGQIYNFTQSVPLGNYYSTISIRMPDNITSTVSGNTTITPIPIDSQTWYAYPVLKLAGYTAN